MTQRQNFVKYIVVSCYLLQYNESLQTQWHNTTIVTCCLGSRGRSHLEPLTSLQMDGDWGWSHLKGCLFSGTSTGAEDHNTCTCPLHCHWASSCHDSWVWRASIPTESQAKTPFITQPWKSHSVAGSSPYSRVRGLASTSWCERGVKEFTDVF